MRYEACADRGGRAVTGWDLFLLLVGAGIGASLCRVAVGRQLDRLRAERNAARRDANTARANLRSSRLAPVMPLTPRPAVHQPGMRLVRGGQQ